MCPFKTLHNYTSINNLFLSNIHTYYSTSKLSNSIFSLDNAICVYKYKTFHQNKYIGIYNIYANAKCDI